MTFPLHGARLIEASAGTGKTFTIAGLYLRLLLGHGSEQSRHPRPLTVDQILVVTFTEAATAELRDRIRARIHDARVAFMRGQSLDPVIKPLLEQIPDHEWAAQTLLYAERQMDEAAVYTIHGFCQRMLTQNAFESGSRFNHEFVTDESKLKAQVVADYWRRNFYPLSGELAATVRSIWSSPGALLKKISGYLNGQAVALTTEPMHGTLEEQHQKNLSRIDNVKQQWNQNKTDIAPVITSSGVSKRTFTKKNLPKWLDEVSAWAESDTLNYQLPDNLYRFSSEFLEEKTKPGDQVPEHELFGIIQSFLSDPPSLEHPLQAHAIQSCRVMLSEAKQQKHWLSFDDLLSQLSAALDCDGEQVLTTRIRSLYPVAMIDEFQDTDPLQYSIFSHIYLNKPDTGLFMIGDPKQAIYAFRGADIFTYIRARNEVSAHYTLGTNWRSTADMVNSVNTVFAAADSPFMYDRDIPFLPVSPRPGAQQRSWTIKGQKQNALTFWLQEAEKPLPKGEYQHAMAMATANQIELILQESDADQACLNDGKDVRVIQAGDIAVLVRTGAEGKLVRQALAQKGIASVYLSNRDSVFLSPVATDMLRILHAVLTPDDEQAMHAALATDLLALNSHQLDELNRDENRWDAVVNEFREYRRLWLLRGVMPMLRAIMSKRHIAERLAEEEFGERLLTDLLHLSELLQQMSLETDSDHGLLRWFAETIQETESGESGASDEQIQRLESEQNLVKIVTIHKSKGLEYDLVFLPFACSYREAQQGQYYDEQQAKTVCDITAQKASLAQADKERLAEDLRLLYVALTRAVYGCFVGLAPVRKGRSAKDPTGLHLSAVGYLLNDGEPVNTALVAEKAGRLVSASGEGEIGVSGLPDSVSAYTQIALFEHDEQNASRDLKARQLQTDIDRSWRITSYSGLVKQGHGRAADIEPQGFDIDSIGEAEAFAREEMTLDEPERSIFTFPRGARPGTFLHTLFEVIDFTQPATKEENEQRIVRLLEAEQYDAEWLPVLQTLADTVLSVPLDGHALRLNQKGNDQRLTEMEFLLPIRVLAAQMLNDIVRRYDALSAQAGELGFQTVKGMLKGFIDLVFEHEGKYYVLDWKSNYLGETTADYDGEALKEAMLEHRYDLQYQIYALALHRFLRSRISDYDYHVHFGGVYYLFLRGIDKQSSGSGVFYARPDFAMIDALDRLIDGQQVEEDYA
ncbi:exodeoxyribonuclease V subunit beta [Vibrio albus]|uniref:RecBCD enzyme subunit RecB n=2 Tax=Vibrio albus TaxID=2200953 RepID=A0A2U3BF65_9VIBR|nr:exodeoxyribonuclease V subunit beta [Vibrio albus]